MVMKKLRKSLLILLIIIFPLIATISCREEIGKLEDYTWEPGMAIPMVNASLNLGNLIPEDTENFQTDDEGLIHFYFREDSVIGFEVEEILEIPTQQNQEMSFKLGAISLDDFGPISTSATLNEMLEMMDTTTANLLQTLDGTTSIFPEISTTSPKDFDYNELDDFEYVTFSSGQLNLKVTNLLPITFATCAISLNTINTQGDTIYLGDFIFNNFLSMSFQAEIIDLAGFTLYNEFMIRINNYTTIESPSPVLINLSDALEFVVSSSNLVVVAGKAKIPQQTIASQSDTLNMSVDGNERLTYLALSKASIDYEIESTLDIGVNFTIDMPQVTVNGSPASFNFSASNQTTGTLDLSNSLFDLTQNSEQPYNNFMIGFSFELQGTNVSIEFDSSSTVRMQYYVGDIEFELAQGWIGVQEHLISSDSVYTGFAELENLSGAIEFANPELKILISNNIGLPIGFDIDINSYTNDGNYVGLNSDNLNIPYPTVPYTSVDSFIVINNQTSNLSEFLAFLPDYFLFGGGVETNPDSANTGIVYNNFVTKDGKINIGLEFELPVSLTINNLQFSDTMVFAMEDLNFEQATSGHFLIHTVNGIPLDATVNLVFVDSLDFIPLDEYEISMFEAAVVDQDGFVVSSTASTEKVEMNTDSFDKLDKANKIIVTVTFNTSNSDTQYVSFLTDYTLDISLAALIKYKFNLNDIDL